MHGLFASNTQHHDRDQLMKLYFELGIKYVDNSFTVLNDKHGYEISESKLKRKLKMRELT